MPQGWLRGAQRLRKASPSRCVCLPGRGAGPGRAREHTQAQPWTPQLPGFLPVAVMHPQAEGRGAQVAAASSPSSGLGAGREGN